jgi:hypothetical protein
VSKGSGRTETPTAERMTAERGEGTPARRVVKRNWRGKRAYRGGRPHRVRTRCKMGLEGIVSKRKFSPYRSGRSSDWLKSKNPACEAVRREEEEDWGR